MANPLRSRIDEDMKNAMRSKDKAKLATIRLLLAAIKQKEVDERIVPDENQIIVIIEKMIKQRKDSIEQFQAGNRPDLVAKENAEIEVLKQYLPEPLSESEIASLIKAAIDATKPASIKELGKVIAHIKPQIQGRADMGKVSAKIKVILES